jgi:hypothetical protein
MVPSLHLDVNPTEKNHLSWVRLAKFTHKLEQRTSSCSKFLAHTIGKQDVALYLIFMPPWRSFPSKILISRDGEFMTAL